MRTRPRLKQELITCDGPGCGLQVVKLYPSRESVRNKLSPYRFCSQHCQRIHWEARRREAWEPRRYPCGFCGTTLQTHQARGRPALYCGSACSRAAAKRRRTLNPSGPVAEAKRRADRLFREAEEARLEAEGHRSQRGWLIDLTPATYESQNMRPAMREELRTGHTRAVQRQQELDGRAQRLARLSRVAAEEVRKRQAVLDRRAEMTRLRRARKRAAAAGATPAAAGVPAAAGIDLGALDLGRYFVHQGEVAEVPSKDEERSLVERSREDPELAQWMRDRGHKL